MKLQWVKELVIKEVETLLLHVLWVENLKNLFLILGRKVSNKFQNKFVEDTISIKKNLGCSYLYLEPLLK